MQSILNTFKKNSMFIVLIIVTLFFQIGTKGVLLVPQNVSNLISQNGYVVILAVGMLMCILTGGNIDLSVGSIVALVGAIGGKLIVTYNMNIYLAMVICILCGALIGAWQGFWIAFARIPAFIVTLSGMLVFRGLALIVLAGLTIAPFPTNYLNLFISFVPDFFGGVDRNLTAIITGIIICVIFVLTQIRSRHAKVKMNYTVEPLIQLGVKIVVVCAAILLLFDNLSKFKGIPSILVLLAIVISAYSYFASKTVPGRYLYAMGGNEKAAKLSGINTDKVLFGAYLNMGVLSALAALACIGRFNSAAPTAGTSYELDAIASCFIGGASAYGGTGTVSGAVIGAIFMGIMNNGMSIMSVDANLQKVIKGLVLLIAVAFDVLSKRKSKS